MLPKEALSAGHPRPFHRHSDSGLLVMRLEDSDHGTDQVVKAVGAVEKGALRVTYNIFGVFFFFKLIFKGVLCSLGFYIWCRGVFLFVSVNFMSF